MPHIEFHFVFQIASLLSDTSSVLNECMETFAQAQDLKTLLGTQKDLSQLGDIGKLGIHRDQPTYDLNVIDINSLYSTETKWYHTQFFLI